VADHLSTEVAQFKLLCVVYQLFVELNQALDVIVSSVKQ
jgi:hypothetical protein